MARKLETFEEQREYLNRPLSGQILVTRDADRLRQANARLAAARERLRKAALAGWARRKQNEATEADLLRAAETRRGQGRRVPR